MALVVEDGTGVDGANTYVTRAGYIAYAAARGVEINDDDPADYQLIKAMDYLSGLNWKGQVLVAFQPLPWPRQFVYIGADVFPTDEVPKDVVSAQCALAMILDAGFDIAPVFSGGLVTEDTVGPITTKYSDKFGPPTGAPNTPAVSALLKKWINSGFSLNVVRA